MATISEFLQQAIETGLDFVKADDKESALRIFDDIAGLHDHIAIAFLYKGIFLIDAGRIEEGKQFITLCARLSYRYEGYLAVTGHMKLLNEYLGKFADLSHQDNVFERSVIGTKLQSWPHRMTIQNIDDLRSVVVNTMLGSPSYKKKFLSKSQQIATLGSCFAVNIGRALNDFGFNVNNNAFNDNATSSYAIWHFTRWLLGNETDKFTEFFQRQYGDEQRSEIHDRIKSSNTIILTIGVAPCLFHLETGEFAFTSRQHGENYFDYIPGPYNLRTTSVQENVEKLDGIIANIRSLNPDCVFIVSVSPVPLLGTNEMPSVIEADCISKSTMRLAVHEIVQKTDNCIYWPSFEIIRWLGAHSDFKMYGADDDLTRHVNRNIVNMIISIFVDLFSEDDAAPDPVGFSR